MKKKHVPFTPVPRTRSPTPLSSTSSLSLIALSPCPPQVPPSGLWPVPPPAPPPCQTKFPSVISRAVPLLPALKASSLCRSSGIPGTSYPVNSHSSPSLPHEHVVSYTASQCLLLPNPSPSPFLASGPLGIGFTGLSPPPDESPLPATISPPLDHPANCPRGQEFLPQGTAQRFRCQIPTVCREQNPVGSSHR